MSSMRIDRAAQAPQQYGFSEFFDATGLSPRLTLTPVNGTTPAFVGTIASGHLGVFRWNNPRTRLSLQPQDAAVLQPGEYGVELDWLDGQGAVVHRRPEPGLCIVF